MSFRPISSLSLVTLTDVGVFVVAVTVLFTVYLKRRNRESYPPGPKGLPIIGNALDIPKKEPWVMYRDLSRKMDSSIICLTSMGTTIIVVNDRETAVDLFEKRGALYFDRPRMPMLNEAGGFAFNFSLTNDAQHLKICRRGFDPFFRKANVQQFREHEISMIHSLLNRILDSPERYVHHIHYMTASMIVDIAYGIQAKPEDDYFISIADRVLRGHEKSTTMSIIDILPWVQHVPSWLPGMRWKKEVDILKKQTLQMADAPYDWVKDQLEKGSAKPCVVTDLITRFEDEINDPSQREYTIKSIAGTVYAAGADTTVSALQSLFLAMTLFPDVQKHAQAEIDRVVGSERMPEFADQDNIPYITAVMKEVLRWAPPIPLAVPRTSATADSYKGYYIPKGAMVFGNAWAMLHDPAIYPDPEEFKPSRFLTSGGALDPAVPDPDVVFGFGRHFCPGRFMALESMWLAMACILASFNIEKTKDENGKPLPMPEELFASGLLQQPNPFPCTITPRLKITVKLIRT